MTEETYKGIAEIPNRIQALRGLSGISLYKQINFTEALFSDAVHNGNLEDDKVVDLVDTYAVDGFILTPRVTKLEDEHWYLQYAFDGDLWLIYKNNDAYYGATTTGVRMTKLSAVSFFQRAIGAFGAWPIRDGVLPILLPTELNDNSLINGYGD